MAKKMTKIEAIRYIIEEAQANKLNPSKAKRLKRALDVFEFNANEREEIFRYMEYHWPEYLEIARGDGI